MFSAIRRHVSAAIVLAFAALVFVITGGAFAANDGGGSPSHATLTASAAKKKAKTKSTRGPAGPKGETGTTGPSGPAGPTGPAGAAGAKGETGAAGGNGEKGVQGEPGTPGKNGTNGTNGESVTGNPIGSGGSKCGGQAGVEYTLKSTTTEVCNGKTGFTETLPAGKTETGTFAAYVNDVNELGTLPIAVSFPIPVEEGASPEAYFLNPTETADKSGPTGCTGELGHPTASPGVLCVYTSELKAKYIEFVPQIIGQGGSSYNTTGTILKLKVEGEKEEREAEPGHIHVQGTWAVTAPTTP